MTDEVLNAHHTDACDSARNVKRRHLRSLREYIEALRELGEIHEITQEVDWNLEIGAITRRCYETGSPAPLFSRVKGAEAGFRVLGAPAGVSSRPGQSLARVALSLGMDPGATALEIVDALSRATGLTPIAPRVVDDAPCLEHILVGDEVDLLKLPTPFIHEGDGGRFLNTWGTIVVRSPDGAWTNWSINRIMLRDRNSMVGIVSTQRHLGNLHAQWKAIGEPMPFALSLGQDPVIPFFAGMPLRDGVSEPDVVGGFVGEPIEVVRCRTVPLEVPASSEIVIEGHIALDEVDDEGPMAEYPGYLVRESKKKRPVYHVSAMMYRDDPILPIVAAGFPPEENHTCWGICIAATIFDELRRAGWPVSFCYIPFEAACHLLVVTVPSDWRERTVHASAPDFAHALGDFVFALRGGTVVPRILVVTDDIDPTDPGEVLWALTTRVHPGDGEIMFAAEPANPRNTFLKENEKAAMFTTKSVLNGLARDEWSPDVIPIRADFDNLYPEALKQRIIEGWSDDYGFPQI